MPDDRRHDFAVNKKFHTRMTYQETVQYLFEATPLFQHIGGKAYKPGLQTSLCLDEHFGHPHKSYPIVHVAGTNGKGSCSHTIAAILQLAGLRVGLFTSPHLLDFRERIRINGKMIPEDTVVQFVESEKGFFEPLHPSFFELTTALAFKYFEDEHVDVAVVEVGLGGRLDCTNIVTPKLSVITNISLDHTQFLGSTLSEIAYEKAGIIKPGVPVIVGEDLPETRQVFLDKAKENNSQIIFAEDKPEVVNSTMTENYTRLYETVGYGTFEGQLAGECQIKNTNTILHVVPLLLKQGLLPQSYNDKKRITALVREAFSEVSSLTGLMGRWQYAGHRPDIVLDTGHNTGGWAYLGKALQSGNYPQVHVIFGIMADKDIDGVLSFLPQKLHYYFTRASVARALPPEALRDRAEKFGLNGGVFNCVSDALEAALKNAKPEDLVYVGGSSFIVADYLAINDKNENK